MRSEVNGTCSGSRTMGEEARGRGVACVHIWVCSRHQISVGHDKAVPPLLFGDPFSVSSTPTSRTNLGAPERSGRQHGEELTAGLGCQADLRFFPRQSLLRHQPNAGEDTGYRTSARAKSFRGPAIPYPRSDEWPCDACEVNPVQLYLKSACPRVPEGDDRVRPESSRVAALRPPSQIELHIARWLAPKACAMVGEDAVLWQGN